MISVYSLLYGIPLFVMAVVMHELAHLFTARFFKVRSKLGLLGIVPCVRYPHKEIKNLSAWQYFWITMSPIPFSFIYLFLFMIVANYDNYLFYGDFFWWILFAVGFGIFGTFIGSRSDIKLFIKFKGN